MLPAPEAGDVMELILLLRRTLWRKYLPTRNLDERDVEIDLS
jgi:hypothetical protein